MQRPNLYHYLELIVITAGLLLFVIARG